MVAIMSSFLGLVVGISITDLYAQNQTETDAEQFAGISTNMIIAIIALVGTGLTFIKALVDRGILDKRIGTVATIAGDSVVAIRDNRNMIQEGIQTGYETVAQANPQLAAEIKSKSEPVMKKITEEVQKYDEKAQKFTAIASKIGKQGENTTDDIKENETLKEQIPDSVVPT